MYEMEINTGCQVVNVESLADLGGGAPGARPPLRVQILSF